MNRSARPPSTRRARLPVARGSALGLSVALALTACNGGDAPATGGRALAQVVGTAPAEEASQAPAGSSGNGNGQNGERQAPFVYSPVGRRDPFRSYLTQLKERQEAKAQDHRREETEAFDINQYRLTGLVTGTTQPKAMVDDPNGEAHVVRIGSRIGKNGGRVYSINAQGLTVVEEYVDASGKLVSVPVTVRLPEEVIHAPEGKE